MTIHDLKEMDLVETRDGRILVVLKNDYTGKLQTFTHSLWGQRELDKYFDNFVFGNNVEYMSPLDRKDDIVAVYQSQSKWKTMNALNLYRQQSEIDDTYEKAKIRNEIYESCNFIRVLV